MTKLSKQQRLRIFLLTAILFTAGSCLAQPATGRPPAAKHTATSYTTSTAQLKSDYLPDSVFQLLNIKILIVKGSDCDYIRYDDHGKVIKNCWALRELPPTIKNLSQLVELRLPVNSLTALPTELAALRRLRLLDLTDNAGLTDINSVTSLTQLQELYLSGCYLEKLPADISRLKNLRTLSLQGSALDSTEQARIRQALPNCAIYF